MNNKCYKGFQSILINNYPTLQSTSMKMGKIIPVLGIYSHRMDIIPAKNPRMGTVATFPSIS